jgi:hypothetical protein
VFPGEFRDRDNINFTDTTDIQQLIKSVPSSWYKKFPSGNDIFELVENYLPWKNCRGDIDKLLQKRRDHEYSLFKHLEMKFVQPIIDKGFSNIDDFIWQANRIRNKHLFTLQEGTSKQQKENREVILTIQK